MPGSHIQLHGFDISTSTVIRMVVTTIAEKFCLPKVKKFEELINEHMKSILMCNQNNSIVYLYM